MTPGDFDALQEALGESFVGRLFHQAGQAWAAARVDSRVARAVVGGVEAVRKRPAADRVQAVALILAGVGLGNLVLRPFVPLYVASAVPSSLWIAELIATLIVAAGAWPLTAAWSESTLARGLRWATGKSL